MVIFANQNEDNESQKNTRMAVVVGIYTDAAYNHSAQALR